MTKSKIEWTDRSDWNPIRGCTRVSPGCGGPGPHGGCYAERIAARFSGPGLPFEGFARTIGGKARWTGKIELIEDRLMAPLHWKKPARIFACSMSDLFHEALPDEAIDRVFAVMVQAPQHTYQILTKREDEMVNYLGGQWARRVSSVARGTLIRPTLANVWIGVSVENQKYADVRRHALKRVAALGWKTWVSYEPALGPVDWTGWEFLRCIVSGGESGADARPSHPDWHRGARDFCEAHGIAYGFKQWGSWSPHDFDATDSARAGWLSPDGTLLDDVLAVQDSACEKPCRLVFKLGKKRAGRLLDGVEHNGVPA